MARLGRRTAPGPLEYARRWPLRLMFLASIVFLYVPILTLIAFSFNDSRRNIVWKGFTLKYYEKALNNDGLIEAFTNSLTPPHRTTCSPKRSVSVSSAKVVSITPPRVPPMPLA